jgi:hypothetical protein
MAEDKPHHTVDSVSEAVRKIIDGEVGAEAEKVLREENHRRALIPRATGLLYRFDPEAKLPRSDEPPPEKDEHASLPPAPQITETMNDGYVGAKDWVAGEIKRMVADGEIHEGTIRGKLRAEVTKILGFEGKLTPKQEVRLDAIRRTDFAKLLESRMRKDAKINTSVRPVEMRYLRNQLADWGFWPLPR